MEQRVQIAFPNRDMDKPLNVLVGDIGGTKTHLAQYHIEDEELTNLLDQKYPSAQYESFEQMIQEFLQNQFKPDRLSVGVAGPVVHGKAKITNLDWTIDPTHILSQIEVGKAYVINDLVANAYGLAALQTEDFLTLHEGDPSVGGNAVIISPGTGLGEAGMYWDGQGYHPFGTEGGHADYAPETEQDIQLLKWLQRKYGHVSWERVVSGMGIVEIYAFLQQTHLEEAVDFVTHQFNEPDAGAAISKGAAQGDTACAETMDIFLRNLANEAANLVMKLMGTGGVFIGGGIIPKNLQRLQTHDFVQYFLEAGRMGTLLEHVPIHIVLNENTALLGAAMYGYYNH